MDSLVETVIALLGSFGVIGVAVAAFIEEVIAFIPSSVVQLGAGVVMMGEMAQTPAAFLKLLLFVALPVAIGATAGSTVLYFLGYYVGKPAIERFGKYIGVFWSDVERVTAFMDKHKMDDIILLSIRIIPIVPSTPVGVFSGIVRFPFWRYCLYTFFGMLVRGYVLGYVGWQVGNLYLEYADALDKYEPYMLGLIGVALLVGIWWLKRRGGKAR